jgi:two-component system chemotaxis response regulator CheB
MTHRTRDLVVLGASAGGLQPLIALLGTLPADLPAALFVVLHLPPEGGSMLASILDRAGPLKARLAEDGEPIEHGRIYVARPDLHLALDGVVHVLKGPRENRHRPSIDVLFRTAARHHGPRVIGVVLSGAMDDGTAGLAAIKRAGGLAIVQEPDDSRIPGMPRSALAEVAVDHVLPAADIGPCIAALVGQPVVEPPPADEADQPTRDDLASLSEPPTAFTCPECGGTLWEVADGEALVYRCHVGHAYSADGLLDAQAETVEAALWSALRLLKEKAGLERRTAARLRQRGVERRAAELERRAHVAEEQASVMWQLLRADVDAVPAARADPV